MAARGGRYRYKTGKMHPAGVHGKHHKAGGGPTVPVSYSRPGAGIDVPPGGGGEPDADDMASGGKADGHWMEKAFANSHGQFKAKAKKAGMSTGAFAGKEATSPHASTKTKRQANLARLGAKYGGN